MDADIDDDEVEMPGQMLQQAAIYNNTEFLESLLQGQERQWVDLQDSYGRTALYTCVTNNSLQCGHMLLQAGADPNISCGQQCSCMTPLHKAALDNKYQFVSLLLQYGAKFNMKDASGETALDLAVKNRSAESITLMKTEQEKADKEKQHWQKEFMDACIAGDATRATELVGHISEQDVAHIINTAHKTQNSLFHKACEKGDVAMVEFLLGHGAQCHVHPVTGHSPLHAACMAGNLLCAEQVLKKFPELGRAPTVDGTLPVHIACADGHNDLVELFLTFPYPDYVRKIFKEAHGDRMCRLGIAINAKDGHGRTPLHRAVLNNHVEIVERLLSYCVPVLFHYKEGVIENLNSSTSDADAEEGIPNINGSSSETPTEMFCPVEVDSIDLEGNSPLHLAVRSECSSGINHKVAELLLENGANPNKPIITSSGNSTALMLACLKEDSQMMELLLRYRAQDEGQKVLKAAVESNDEDLVSVFLKYRSHPDLEYKINFLALLQEYHDSEMSCNLESAGSVTIKSIWPNVAVMLNWHGVSLKQLAADWMVKSCIPHNGRPSSVDVREDILLHTITRIDISRNQLQQLPLALFQLTSLRILNAENNMLQTLPSSDESGVSPSVSSSQTVDTNGGDPQCMKQREEKAEGETEEVQWNCPVLEEINLNRNCLSSLPVQLFRLPALRRLTASNNAIESLPFDMWKAPMLSELNLASNKLRSLPHSPQPHSPSHANFDPGHYDVISIASTSDSASGSVPNTPKKQTTFDQQPMFFDDNSLLDAVDSSASSPEKYYQDLPVNSVSYWQGRLKVKQLSNYPDLGSTGQKQSKLTELNLARNQFESVPLGLSCLAPALVKLVLFHNKVTTIGSLSNYPASLRILDLSHNAITGEGFRDQLGMDEDRGVVCFSGQHQPNKHVRRRSASTSRAGNHGNTMSVRNSSNSSLQSLGSTPSGASPMSLPSHCCRHRLHCQLDRLRSLKLCNNKLSRLHLALETEDFSSSGEDSQISSSSVDSRRGSRLGVEGEPAEHKQVQLLFPNLSTLDLSSTGLNSLPPEISEQSQLTELKISHNKLKELPPRLGMLTKLWNLDLRGCPVEKTLQSILGERCRKTAAILGYLKSVRDEATLYNRMKLMFVGVQGIGKTSLLNQLRKEGKVLTPKSYKNWAQRMGHSSSKDKDLKGENISTVGVDIGDLVLQRGSREVMFRTWDFGGQREYYATHQYFLSKRAIYLVVWKVTDGEKGINEIHQWLVNIQARAPNSPVIIVGTHLDNVTKKKYPTNFLADLQQMLKEKYVYHPEPEKCGLPRVIGHLEVSCKSRLMYTNHITDLVSMIWTVAVEEMLPGNKSCKLLEQKVPASYVHLQDAIGILAEERKLEGKDPVLHADQYKPLVMNKMEELYKTSFRDVAELNQATQFLHENGVLLHYDDVTLQDIYFLDPQWLCDILANVVTIREINSLAKAGIMRTEDLKVLFKNAAFKPEDIKTYIIDLLNKFEVALLWDEQNLLIPSLLPKEQDLMRGFNQSNLLIPVRGSSSSRNPAHHETSVIYTRIRTALPSEQFQEGQSTFYIRSPSHDKEDGELTPTQNSVDFPVSTDGVASPGERPGTRSSDSSLILPLVTSNHNPATALLRLYLMAYFPSGFWPRLITRLLGDETFYTICMDLYQLPEVLASSETYIKQCWSCPKWKCWQTGLELLHLGVTVLRIKEVDRQVPNAFCDYRQCRLVIQQEHDHDWNDLNLQVTSILEILLPNESLNIQVESQGMSQENQVVHPDAQVVAALLAKVVEHLDTLLEDWYPDLGARFIQNTRGMYLITRVVPCTRCVLQQIEYQRRHLEASSAWAMVDVSPEDSKPQITQPVLIDPPVKGSFTARSSQAFSAGSEQRGLVYIDTVPDGGGLANAAGQSVPNGSSSSNSVETSVLKRTDSPEDSDSSSPEASSLVYCNLVEQCLQAAQINRIVYCRLHGNLGPFFIASDNGHVQLAHVAPDSVFQDIGEKYVVKPDHVTRGKFLGKGAFGAVYAGTVLHRENDERADVAIKMLQPVKPGPDASQTHLNNYLVEKHRWDKDPMKNACEAYLNARKELSILLALKHPNIVPLVGISLHPLSLILSLAPQGALSDKLVEYHRAGARLLPSVLREIVIQVASALQYLHSHQIIYRDLKSENILVWSLPSPHQSNPNQPTEVKLADYGVSRSVLPSGAKGLAGTPPFIAPEIIQHNGEETYTEKVDCFSFGMFLYELLALRTPFEGEGSTAGVANIKAHVLSGARPVITNKDLTYPTHVLDLMSLCWSHDPSDRPSAADIVVIATKPEFCHLQMAVCVDGPLEVTCSCSAPFVQDIPAESPMIDMLQMDETSPTSTVWLGTKSLPGMDGEIRVFTYQQHQCVEAKRLFLGPTVITYMCVVDKWVWCADTASIIHIFSLLDYSEVLKFPATTRPQAKVRCLGYNSSERQVFVVLDNGHFILCDADIPPYPSINYTPVKNESHGNGRPIHCLKVLLTAGGGSELWCGQNHGRIGIWDLNNETGSLRTACHFNTEQPRFDVVSIATSATDNKWVWSYVYPGSTVYRWDVHTRSVSGTTDISVLVPNTAGVRTSDSGQLKANKCQVTALHVLNRHLYIGTTWGCLIVVNAATMAAISVIRCHRDQNPYVQSILSLWQPETQVPLHLLGMTDSVELRSLAGKDSTQNDLPGIVTVGAGYRNLFDQVMSGKVAAASQTRTGGEKPALYLLSWLAENWQVTGYTEKKQTTV